ncbi:MarR family winged helix-turn-helix transcriptional regulator [Sphingomonas sp. ID0503]|uniref:MarR family winged helix-turn-helix transcriptional regulator n=1 Tax=Sphingomonas sp. ID0503 TaxID=3399691 RepID=UPI003AFB5E83
MTRHEKERQAASALYPLARRWHAAADEALGGLGIKSAAAWCLVHLARLGPDVRQVDLAEAIGITEPSLARTVQLVIADGLVERSVDPADRRSSPLRLTAKGMELAAVAEERLAALRRELLTGISDADLDRVLGVFASVAARLGGRRLGL